MSMRERDDDDVDDDQQEEKEEKQRVCLAGKNWAKVFVLLVKLSGPEGGGPALSHTQSTKEDCSRIQRGP